MSSKKDFRYFFDEILSFGRKLIEVYLATPYFVRFKIKLFNLSAAVLAFGWYFEWDFEKKSGKIGNDGGITLLQIGLLIAVFAFLYADFKFAMADLKNKHK